MACLRIAFCLVLVTFYGAVAQAIVPDYPTSDWKAVGRVGRQWPGNPPKYNGTGVVIGDRWVLTARHLLNDTPTKRIPDNVVRFWLEGKGSLTPRRVYVPPDLSADLALLEFAPRTFSEWYPPYRESDEMGKLAAVVGYGYTFENRGGKWVQKPNSDGVRRAGFNRISMATDIQLRMDFDVAGAPDRYGDGGPVEKECMVAGHDSGGPSLIRGQDGKWRVAGIHSAVADGITSGGRFYDVRVSRYIGWLDSILGRSEPFAWYNTAPCPLFGSLRLAAPRTTWIPRR
ncbi:MAG: hypothetical protein D6724_09860 [Armatimonadetes bacterium]|nr:MAG: hypothetical protein D6724_09860 [Armatimonadota bacterium]